MLLSLQQRANKRVFISTNAHNKIINKVQNIQFRGNNLRKTMRIFAHAKKRARSKQTNESRIAAQSNTAHSNPCHADSEITKRNNLRKRMRILAHATQTCAPDASVQRPASFPLSMTSVVASAIEVALARLRACVCETEDLTKRAARA